MQEELNWKTFLDEERNKDYYIKLKQLVMQDSMTHKVFPPTNEIYNAFKLTPISDIKVVIIGQDPYHEIGQAHGLAFSVRDGVKLPPSLKNIYKEIESEFGYKMSNSGDLTKWAKQGVLLLNSSLTVNEGMPASHKGYGWEIFTSEVVKLVNSKLSGIVFLLWGRHAQEYEKYIDSSKHFILKTTHPSPFSVRYGFEGCGHFKKANDILLSQGKQVIDWQI